MKITYSFLLYNTVIVFNISIYVQQLFSVLLHFIQGGTLSNWFINKGTCHSSMQISSSMTVMNLDDTFKVKIIFYTLFIE